MFQELDTPPSRCCWRCGCAMSCVSLITADIDQAFEACSASAVLPPWRHISQSHESRFSSNSVLVRRGRRELCKPGRSQSFGRGRFSFSTHVLARVFFQLHVGLVSNVGVHGVADSVYSNWWCHELSGCGCGVGCSGTGVVGSATEAQGDGFPFLGTARSKLHIVKEICR